MSKEYEHLPESIFTVYEIIREKLLWVDWGEVQGINPSVTKEDLIVIKSLLKSCILDPKWGEVNDY